MNDMMQNFIQAIKHLMGQKYDLGNMGSWVLIEFPQPLVQITGGHLHLFYMATDITNP